MSMIPSYHTFKYQLPGNSRFENWRGAPYPTRMSPRAVVMRKLKSQRAIAACVSLYLKKSNEVESLGTQAPTYQHILRLNDYGFNSLAMGMYDRLQKSKVVLPSASYVPLVRSFRAKEVHSMIAATQCEFDFTEARKRLGDHGGIHRVEDAVYMVESQLSNADPNVKIHLLNALMEVMNTGGFDSSQRVYRNMYDTIGTLRLNPTLDTYMQVILALGMCGEVAEAKSVFTWLRRTVGSSLPIQIYTIMFEIYKENKLLEDADALLTELLD
eukprot:PhF_6_TR13614/c0_g1_i2/m.21787